MCEALMVRLPTGVVQLIIAANNANQSRIFLFNIEYYVKLTWRVKAGEPFFCSSKKVVLLNYNQLL